MRLDLSTGTSIPRVTSAAGSAAAPAGHAPATVRAAGAIVPFHGINLEASRLYCEHLTRTQARNFYYGLKLLPEPKRSAMFALYAWMRLVDDIADEDDGRTIDQRSADLEAWGEQTRAVLGGQPVRRIRPQGHEIWPAFAAMVRQYNLPLRVFEDVIAGQLQDLQPIAFESFDELYLYCYRVAGTVGLASIYVWGFDGQEDTEMLAVERGVAFQLTNILRDLREDAARGRIYLPRQELAAQDMSEEELRSALDRGRGCRKFHDLMRQQIARADGYYHKSRELEGRIAVDSRATLSAMTAIYSGLLRKVAREPERVLRERVSLSIFHKLLIGWRASRTDGGAAGFSTPVQVGSGG